MKSHAKGHSSLEIFMCIKFNIFIRQPLKFLNSSIKFDNDRKTYLFHLFLGFQLTIPYLKPKHSKCAIKYLQFLQE